jgi:hypothetical protein
VIKFVSDLWQVDGFFRVLRFPPPIKLTIAEILLKVALNTIKKQTNKLFEQSESPKQLPKQVDTSVVLIVFDGCLCEVHAYTATVS